MKMIKTPISEEVIEKLKVGDMVHISGKIYCGRDAVLPKICRLIDENRFGGIWHRFAGKCGFSYSGKSGWCRPTSSNKLEIEGSFPTLSRAGVKLHLGKGAIGIKTISALEEYKSVFAVIPPVTALLGENTLSKRIVAFPELGMEAFYELEVKDFPAIIAAAHNESIY